MHETRRHDLDDLLTLMARLRDPRDGCPWDRRQDFASIAPFTVEETYEVVDAIEREDWAHLQEELGDLLFQVVFYAQMGRERGLFDFAAIVQGIVEKLLRRHPHVFPDGTLESRLEGGEVIDEATIKANWERIKQAEKTIRREASAESASRPTRWLDDVPRAMPPLQRAERLQKRAARVGFDWPEVRPVIAKIREELDELERELDAETGVHEDPETRRDRVRDELGDVLFCSVNLARFLRIEADDALRSANRKFERRFGYIEDRLCEQGVSLEDAPLDLMDRLWDAAKREGL